MYHDNIAPLVPPLSLLMETCQLSQRSEDQTVHTSQIIDPSPPLSMTENIKKYISQTHKKKNEKIKKEKTTE